MITTIEVDNFGDDNRRVTVSIAARELANVHLHLAFPEARNRTGLYMRRHSAGGSGQDEMTVVGPNAPFRCSEEPRKLTIQDHLEQMRRAGILPIGTPPEKSSDQPFSVEPAMFVVPVSDLVANLLRPCFHRDGLGGYRLFHFIGEPIDSMKYWCACFFTNTDGSGRLELRWVRFDMAKDRALDDSGADLLEAGLVWAAALVPLVVNDRPLPASEIARYDYDLRQILGRNAETAIRGAYKSWFDGWSDRVAEAVAQHELAGKPFARFYHSVLGLDRCGNIVVRQVEDDIAGLATTLAGEGLHNAGLLDSGGSCALYDVWMNCYLNHGWYFREPRGAILVFELTSTERLPQDKPGVWVQRRRTL